jgi:hypothetical protein
MLLILSTFNQPQMEQTQMKINLKIIIALALVVVVSYWAVDSLSQRSYTGSNLSFGVGSGPVTVTNPSDEAVPVQLVSPETRSFGVSTAIEGVGNTSAREGTGRDTVQMLAFELPSGVSEFTVTRGRNVNFVATTDTDLEVTVQPVNASDARSTLIAAGVVLLGALFYISRTTGHRWMNLLRRQATSDLVTKKSEERATFKRILGRTNPN